MERLTMKSNSDGTVSQPTNFYCNARINKLTTLEDLMEKHNIDTIEYLDAILTNRRDGLNRKDQQIEKLEKENIFLTNIVDEIKGKNASEKLVNTFNVVMNNIYKPKFDECENIKQQLHEQPKKICDDLREILYLDYDDKYGSICITGIKKALDVIQAKYEKVE